MAESQSFATQADLRYHHDDLQRLLCRLTSEVLREQKQQLEQNLDNMMYMVARGGHNETITEVPVAKIPLRTSARAATWSRTSQEDRDVLDPREKRIGSQYQTSETGSLRSSAGYDSAGSVIEGMPSENPGLERSFGPENSPSSKKSRFIAGDIEKTVRVEAQSDHDRRLHPCHRSMSWASQSTRLFSRLDRTCARSITSPAFDVFCGLIICFNAILVGVETEYFAQDGRVPKSIEVMQYCLSTWYMVELLLRLYVYKRSFFVGEDKNWNLFDTFLVASAFVDLALSNINMQHLKTARILRVVRLFRIVRTLRIIRAFKYVREFRKMVYSLISSLQTLFWSLMMVFGVMYSFALWFTASAATYKVEQAGTQDARIAATIHALNTYYSSFGRTTYTLFASIAGGCDWSIVVDPWISAQDWLSSIMFFIYISIAVFGLMNIVTSVFVESAMHATKHFQDLLVDAQNKDLELYTFHMRRIFREIDTDDSGTISFNEMQFCLNDAASELPQYLEALGISSADVWVLFRLLDKDCSGSIDIEEFCEGCMRLKGEARSFDINCMIFESRAMIKNHADFMEFVEERLQQIGRQLEQLEFGERASRGYSAMLPKIEKL